MDYTYRPLLVFGSTCICTTFRTSSFLTLDVQFSLNYMDMYINVDERDVHVTKIKPLMLQRR